MTKNKISLIKSVVKIDDRTIDGNLKSEARERILKSVKEYLEHTGRANISEMSQMLGLSRQTTKNLVDEIMAEWSQDIQDQTVVQTKWIESTLKDIDQHPETFDKDKIAVVNLKSSLFSKLNALQKLAIKEDPYRLIICQINKNTPKELPDAKPPP